MKESLYVWFCLALLCGELSAQRPNIPSLISQPIQYHSVEAREVFLIWYCANGEVPEALAPGSYVKDQRIHTPMRRNGNVFYSNLTLPEGSLFRYSFWVTKGPGNINTDVTDNNEDSGGDYLAAASERLLRAEAGIRVRPSETISLLNYPRQILIAVAFLFVCIVSLRYMYIRRWLSGSLAKGIVATICILLLSAIFLIRPAVLGIDWNFYFHPLRYSSELFWAGFYDLLYVAVLTFIFLLLIAPFRRFPQVQFGVAYLFIAISLFSMIAGIINVKILEMFGKPGVYEWMFSNDQLRLAGLSVSVPDNVSTSYVLNLIVICMAAVIAGAMLFTFLEMLLQNEKAKKVLLVCSTFLCVSWVVVAQEAISKQNWRPEPANQMSVFLGTINPFLGHSENPLQNGK